MARETQQEAQGSILARTAFGAAWVVAWRMATRLMGLVSTLILVRLLAPEDFGLIALASSFAVALEVCLVLGVEDQIVRAKAPDRAMYDTGFTLNLLRGLLVGTLVWLAAGPAAGFFGDARLEPVLLALALSAALSGLTNIGAVEFRRNLRFEREFALNLYPRLLGIVVTIGLAFLVRSHWALVAGIFVNRCGLVLMSYILHPYRPRLTLVAWRGLAGVSAWTWALSVTNMVKDRSESLVIGRVLGPTSVGHYAVGLEVAILPSSELVDPVCRACMPGFAASHRSEADAGQANYLRICALLALLTLPAGIGLSAVAGPVIALGFGQAWLEAVPVVVILGIASVLTPFGNVSSAMLVAHTRLSTLIAIALGAGATRLGLLLLLTPGHGLFGAALAVGIAVLAEHMVLVQRALSLLRLSFARLLRQLWRPALATAAMAALLWTSGLGWAGAPDAPGRAALRLLEGVALGSVSYLALLVTLWLLSGRPTGAEADLLALVRRMLGRLGQLRVLSRA
ncbi:oligosaccharide flippase family protein [Falsiroseomonas tokyonensis]|uniref:Oligosaccharide flippase family protein n=1 Tax=Falsiroseomonas tokyonensis TaxID=430521 RepID=A0ABV7BMD7_9PROT|nr:oligosaccharide flippase family protein [Falsiroseomonas tokyonensis]MBU8536735.1 oligosaccharide flippase family protein [Falsiroseomonas tokyonensis]